MKKNLLMIFFTMFVLSSCAAYLPQPLSRDHPAQVDAPSVPRPAPSRTLAYTRADIPSPSRVSTSAVADPGGRGSALSNTEAAQTVTAEGKVVATVPGASQIVVEHGEIKGFMDAMTMGYRTEPSSLLEGLQFGDKIRFTVDVGKKAIIKIEKIK